MTLEEMDRMKLTSTIEAIQQDDEERVVVAEEEQETAMVPPITDNNNNDSEKENLMQTQAEINSDATTETDKELDITQNSQSRSKTIVVSDQESSSIGTTQSTQSSNVEFSEMDFTRMSLSDLKHSIRHRPAPKRGPSVSEINWDQQKSVFKEL